MPGTTRRLLCMAYREVRVMDIEQVIRRWTAGEAIRAIARTTGLDRNTVRGLIRLARKTGLKAMMNLASASNNARMMSRKSGFIGTLELPLFQTQLPGQQDTFRRRQLCKNSRSAFSTSTGVRQIVKVMSRRSLTSTLLHGLSNTPFSPGLLSSATSRLRARAKITWQSAGPESDQCSIPNSQFVTRPHLASGF